VQYSPVCVFYCKGDKMMLTKLCSQVQGLGKHRSAGGGNIVSFSIESTTEDLSLFHDHKCMRAIPVEFCQQHQINFENKVMAQLAYKPPFWDKNHFCLCVSPEEGRI